MKLVSISLCALLLLQPVMAANQVARTTKVGDHPFTALTASEECGLQAAEILGVREQLDQLLVLQRSETTSEEKALRMLDLRGRILRKVLLGVLEVRTACNKLEIESALTYHALDREQRRLDSVNELFNLANFIDFGTLYTMEGAARLDKQFIASRVFTCTSAGVGTTLPTLNILYHRAHRDHDVVPPKFLEYVLDDGRVADSRLPEHVSRFLDSREPGTTQTRREFMHTLWKNEFQADITEVHSFWNYIDGRSKPPGSLHTRILILWSLHTFIEDFDRELLALIKVMAWNEPSGKTIGTAQAISPSLSGATTLLGIQSQVAELMHSNSATESDRLRRCQLESFVLYKVLESTLETRVAINKIHAELNHANNIVLSHLLAQRKRNLQRDFEMNFIQKGILGATAGLLYFHEQIKAGNELFVISGGIGTLMATVALKDAHGGKRKCDALPNSLADFLDLTPDPTNRFSPFIAKFLESPDPQRTDGVSRKQTCIENWQRDKIVPLDMRKRSNRLKVADMPPSKNDTISIARTRIALLHSVKGTIESIDQQLLLILLSTEPAVSGATTSGGGALDRQLGRNASEAASLLGVQQLMERVKMPKATAGAPPELNSIENQLLVTRRIFSAQVETTATGSTTNQEIVHESEVLARMKHARDLGVALTNNANFYQINILELIINGPLGLSTPKNFPAGDRLTIISGASAIGLATAAFLERHGGFRHSQAGPNMLGPCLGVNSPAVSKFSPMLLRFLNSADPYSANNKTRKEELIEYWVQSKILSNDVRKAAVQERLCATGPNHHWWDETIKLITDRIAMLYDLRAVVDLMDAELADLLRQVD